jgi:hypothetical protein
MTAYAHRRRSGVLRLSLAILLVAALGGAGDALGQADASALRTYWNAKWQFAVTYPSDVFREWQELPDGDGRRFVAADGATFVVSGGRNELAASAHDVMKLAAEYYQKSGAIITYERAKNDWYVLSGYEGRWIYYERAWIGGDGAYDVLLIRFPADKRDFYYDPVERMSWSFKRRSNEPGSDVTATRAR